MFKSRSTQLLILLASLLLPGQVATQCAPKVVKDTPVPYLGPSTAQYTSCASGADSPRVFNINTTSYDWWYFDAVSSDASQALTVVFFTSGGLGFPYDVEGDVDNTNVWIWGTFPDGTTTVLPIPATAATITTVKDGSSGIWHGSGASWDGAPDLSTYRITWNNNVLGITGTAIFKSLGPGHYPCSQFGGGKNEILLPNVGWANVMPSAAATVDMTIVGKTLKFEGNGYHDKNWGDMPLTSAIQSWYWGHGKMGDISLVWFDAIDSTGVEHVSGYALRDGKVVGSSCDSLVVRPTGNSSQSQYPPTVLSSPPSSYNISMIMSDGTPLVATLQATTVQMDIVLYRRWIGVLTGTVGGKTTSGAALWEQFTPLLSD